MEAQIKGLPVNFSQGREQAPVLHCRERDPRNEIAEVDEEWGNQIILVSV
jgi:hypothetical protein